MDEPLDERYFKWLYRQVASVRLKNPARTYWSLARQLFTKEFVWLIPNDDNRVEDGRDLRYEFLKQQEIEADPEWMGLGCSVFEMMIGISRRLAFESWGGMRYWFWALLENLDLNYRSDEYYNNFKGQEDIVDDIIDTVIWRTYDADGRGGLFPLNNPSCDQRQVELWYQLSSYILERS